MTIIDLLSDILNGNVKVVKELLISHSLTILNIKIYDGNFTAHNFRISVGPECIQKQMFRFSYSSGILNPRYGNFYCKSYNDVVKSLNERKMQHFEV